METLPSVALLCSLVAAFFSDALSSPDAPILLVPLLAWVTAVVIYRHRYRFVVGATSFLILFHVAGWLLVVGFVLSWSGTCAIRDDDPGFGFILVVIGGPMLAFGWWLYRRARGILRRMHDQLAARTAAPEPKP